MREDIDEVFKNRFEGLKDHSVDPTAQWQLMEAQLTGFGAASSAAASGSSFVAMAASFASMAILAGVATQDQSPNADHLFPAVAIQVEHSSALDHIIGKETLKIADWDDVEQPSVAYNQSELRDIQSGVIEDQTADVASSESHENSYLAQASDDGSAPEVEMTSPDLTFDHLVASSSSRPQDHVLLMRKRELLVEAKGVEDRSSEFTLPSRDLAFQKHSAFLRGGARFGYSESNSSNHPAKWAVDGLVTLGYVYAINPRTSISMEAGLIQRSGNGVERSKDVDLKPLFSVLINSYSNTAEEEMAFRRNNMNVRESLVATQMSYLHLPVSVRVNLSKRSNASIGCYADYLLRARNEAYMVYNSEDYVTTDLGIGDEHSKEGLNLWRMGLSAGFEHSLTHRVSADIRAMLPINSVYDQDSDYYLHAQPNQPVDFQFSLKYKI